MKLLTHIPRWLTNKYLIAIATFAVIMLFFDKNDFFTLHERKQELYELEQSKAYYTRQIEDLNAQRLDNKPSTLERISREKYLMKRDNEDLFIIEDKPVAADK